MSFDIALSGIQAINESLDVTSHNIANAGTYGFKASRANFGSLVAGGSPTGTHIGSTTQNIGKSGGTLNTGRSLDASVNGAGFFVAKDATGQTSYTRVGIFDASKEGFLIDATGRKVQGFPQTPPSTILGAQGDLPIPTGQIPAVASTKMSYVGNMSADWLPPLVTPWVAPAAATATTPAVVADPGTFNMSKASVLYDTLGGQHTLTQYFINTAPGAIDVKFVLDGTDTTLTTSLTFDPANGKMLSPVAPGQVPVTGLTGVVLASGAKLNDIIIDYTGTTGFNGEATTSANAADGYASGVFAGVDLAADGSVIAKYSNGQKQSVGKIALATFPDEGALTAISDTSWAASTTSGEPLVSVPGNGMAGTLNTSTLEQSNVDITSELVGLMTSQRNYQANSKVIQTESTMLQSLMQAI